MKKYFFSITFFIIQLIGISQNANISGIINSYASVTGIACQSLNVNTTGGFLSGDRVMLIQMKGAKIDSSNSPAFGNILSYFGAGNYEMATISSISGNTISLVDSVLKQYFIAGVVQLVKVPQFINATVTGPLTCATWNGTTGGILAFEVSGTLTLNANIDVSGKGFMGGGLSNGALVNCLGDTADYVSSSTNQASAWKGEGIVNPNLARREGKGAYANGGGGGCDCNGGGAGGGNFGAGGHGGDSKCNVTCPPYFYENSGGYPGKSLFYSNTINKIYLGGGGGAGHQNNNGGSPGTNGGGIILIKADSISGNNFYVKSDGLNNYIIANIDGQGGGGAGGTILFSTRVFQNLNVSALGGNGGVDNFTGSDCHGKGGGGGGGILWTTAPIITGVTMFLSGGLPGVFTSPGSLCYNGSNGATPGQNGLHIIDLIIPESTGYCLTGINAYKDNYKAQIYPNPSSGYITVKIDPILIGTEYCIIDQMGRIVLFGKFANELHNVDVQGLNAGMYFFTGKQLKTTIKLIKN